MEHWATMVKIIWANKVLIDKYHHKMMAKPTSKHTEQILQTLGKNLKDIAEPRAISGKNTKNWLYDKARWSCECFIMAAAKHITMDSIYMLCAMFQELFTELPYVQMDEEKKTIVIAFDPKDGFDKKKMHMFRQRLAFYLNTMVDNDQIESSYIYPTVSIPLGGPVF